MDQGLRRRRRARTACSAACTGSSSSSTSATRSLRCSNSSPALAAGRSRARRSAASRAATVAARASARAGWSQAGSSARAASRPARNPATPASSGAPGRRAEGTVASRARLPSSRALANPRNPAQAASAAGSGRGRLHMPATSPRMTPGAVPGRQPRPVRRRPDDTHTEHAMARLALSPVPPERAEADLLVLPVAAGEAGPVAPPVTAAVLDLLGADLAALAGRGRFTGALDDALVVPGYGALAAPAVLLVGVGAEADRTAETLRRAAAVAVAAAGKAASLAVALHRAGLPDPPDPPGPAADGAALAAVVEGTALAAYRFRRHKSAPDPDLAAATLLVDGDRSLAAAEPVLRRAEVAARATLAARDLVNEPASRINPATLAAEAVRLARAAGLEHRVLAGPALRRGRFGAVLAVGGGSASGPRLVELRHRPANP